MFGAEECQNVRMSGRECQVGRVNGRAGLRFATGDDDGECAKLRASSIDCQILTGKQRRVGGSKMYSEEKRREGAKGCCMCNKASNWSVKATLLNVSWCFLGRQGLLQLR